MTCQKLPLSISRLFTYFNNSVLRSSLFKSTCDSPPLCCLRAAFLFPCPASLQGCFPRWSSCLHANGGRHTHTQSDATQQSNHGRGKATGACDETDKAEFSIHSACLAVKKRETFKRDTLRLARVQYENPISESKERGCGCRPFLQSESLLRQFDHRDPVIPPVKDRVNVWSFNGSVL